MVRFLIFELSKLDLRERLGGSRVCFYEETNESPLFSRVRCHVRFFFSGRVTRANRVITFYTRRGAQFVHCLGGRGHPRGT